MEIVRGKAFQDAFKDAILVQVQLVTDMIKDAVHGQTVGIDLETIAAVATILPNADRNPFAPSGNLTTCSSAVATPQNTENQYC